MTDTLKVAKQDQSHIFPIEKCDIGYHIRPEISQKWIAAIRYTISLLVQKIIYYYYYHWIIRFQPSDDGDDVYDILFNALSYVNVIDCNCGPNDLHHFDVGDRDLLSRKEIIVTTISSHRHATMMTPSTFTFMLLKRTGSLLDRTHFTAEISTTFHCTIATLFCPQFQRVVSWEKWIQYFHCKGSEPTRNILRQMP